MSFINSTVASVSLNTIWEQKVHFPFMSRNHWESTPAKLAEEVGGTWGSLLTENWHILNNIRNISVCFRSLTLMAHLFLLLCLLFAIELKWDMYAPYKRLKINWANQQAVLGYSTKPSYVEWDNSIWLVRSIETTAVTQTCFYEYSWLVGGLGNFLLSLSRAIIRKANRISKKINTFYFIKPLLTCWYY